VENIADSRDATKYRDKVTDGESVSMWQSLAFGPNYKAAYCLSVCPAGEDVLGPFLHDRGGFVAGVVKPLQQKEETLYVQPNSDAEDYAKRRFPHKTTKRIGAVLRPVSIDGFIKLMKHGFQPGQSKGLVRSISLSLHRCSTRRGDRHHPRRPHHGSRLNRWRLRSARHSRLVSLAAASAKRSFCVLAVTYISNSLVGRSEAAGGLR
jgi:hypothetical protein